MRKVVVNTTPLIALSHVVFEAGRRGINLCTNPVPILYHLGQVLSRDWYKYSKTRHVANAER